MQSASENSSGTPAPPARAAAASEEQEGNEQQRRQRQRRQASYLEFEEEASDASSDRRDNGGGGAVVAAAAEAAGSEGPETSGAAEAADDATGGDEEEEAFLLVESGAGAAAAAPEGGGGRRFTALFSCPPREGGASRRRRLLWKNAAIAGGLALLWAAAAALVVRQERAAAGADESRRERERHRRNFPPLRLTSELAYLSLLIYKFKAVDDPDQVCPAVHGLNHSGYFDPGNSLTCHWYHHDSAEGTQVMLVSTGGYAAVVFSGTDDVQTSLTDVDLFTAEPTYFNTTEGYDSRIRIHAGFHQAVFSGVLDNVTAHLRSALDSEGKGRGQGRRGRKRESHVLYTTGHSLGGANAILTALALQAAPEFRQLSIQSVSFGCPRIGNLYWRDFANALSSSSPVVRVVLGWDLVPRLPEFLLHVGHTFQLSKAYSWISTPSGSAPSDPEMEEGFGLEESEAAAAEENSGEAVASFWGNGSSPAPWNASAYYLHYGEPAMGYAGVPLGWSATPFLWVPGAMSSHSVRRYVSTLANLTEDRWARDFVRTPPAPPAPTPDGNNRTSPPAAVDDDFYAEPPALSGPLRPPLVVAEPA
jgi:hypothetical protein